MIFSFILGALIASAAVPASAGPLPSAASALPPSAAARAGGRESALRRAVALLDYVAGDYARAVGPDGKLLSEDEHREQVGFVSEAAKELRAEGGEQGAQLARKLDGLLAKVSGRAPPAQVGPEARALRDEVAQRFGVVLLPAQAPDPQRGAALYQLACARCHGAGGELPKDLAELQLQGKPLAFHSEEDVKSLTPQRAFSAITYGVPNTSMPAWEEAFDDKARWDLAFYVLSLAHPQAAGGGKKLAEAALVPTGYRELAALSDEAIAEKLQRAGLSADDRARVSGALRGGPFEEEAAAPGRLGAARRSLAEAVALAKAGDREAAKRAVLSLYLDEFEPHEPALRARDSALVARIERGFLDVRSALESRAGDFERPAAQLDELLAKADAAGGSGSALVPFVAALVIALREGVEAALLVAALLALLRKAGRERDAHAVHLGWGSALLAGAATWWASGALLGVSGMRRELAEGVLQLATAALLLYGSHWLLAAAYAKRLMGTLAQKATRGSAAVVFGLAFAAIYREMFETVIFFRGLLLESAGAGHAVLAGALLGLVLLAVLVIAFQRVGRRLRPRPLLLTCGVLLCGLAVVMVGNGARALQEIGALPLKVWSGLQLPALGVYGTREGLLLQAAVLLGLLASALWTVRRRKREESARTEAGTRPAHVA